jgi:hypothetical protein
MSSNHRADNALARARHAAAQLNPLARSTGTAVKRGVRSTRAWVAPQLEHTGQVLQDRVAPKVSGLLHSAAQRVEPAKPRRWRWRKMAGASALTAAAGAVTGAVLNRHKHNGTAPEANTDGDHETGPRNGQSAASTEDGAEENSDTPTS